MLLVHTYVPCGISLYACVGAQDVSHLLAFMCMYCGAVTVHVTMYVCMTYDGTITIAKQVILQPMQLTVMGPMYVYTHSVMCAGSWYRGADLGGRGGWGPPPLANPDFFAPYSY